MDGGTHSRTSLTLPGRTCHASILAKQTRQITESKLKHSQSQSTRTTSPPAVCVNNNPGESNQRWDKFSRLSVAKSGRLIGRLGAALSMSLLPGKLLINSHFLLSTSFLHFLYSSISPLPIPVLQSLGQYVCLRSLCPPLCFPRAVTEAPYCPGFARNGFPAGKCPELLAERSLYDCAQFPSGRVNGKLIYYLSYYSAGKEVH